MGSDGCRGEGQERIEERFQGGDEFDGPTVEAVVGAVRDGGDGADGYEEDEEGVDNREGKGLERVVGGKGGVEMGVGVAEED